jgi:DNA modification methylase
MAKEIDNQINFLKEDKKEDEPVVCLGMTFENDDVRRAYFTEELRKKLPGLKKIEGFPIGDDEDILALSEPPYYTACPNPFITEIIKEWEESKDEKYEKEENYNRKPFAIDVHEGKNDPIYNAHYYHTKVPYKAIKKYILHYTKPGDIVFDGFCGSGMTGVAAQMCSLIDSSSFIEGYCGDIKEGYRRCILSDISPNATFIAKNNNIIGKIFDVRDIVDEIIENVYKRNINLIKTNHVGWKRGTSNPEIRKNNIISSEKKGIINYTVWSDVFICQNCGEEIAYWNLVFNGPGKPINEKLICYLCGAEQNKNKMTRKFERKQARHSGELTNIAKQIPVLINYTFNGKRYEKYPDKDDLVRMKNIEDRYINFNFYTSEIPNGFNTNQPKQSHGLKFNYQFLSEINLLLYKEILEEIYKSNAKGYKYHLLLFLLSSCMQRVLKFNRYMPNHDRHVGPLSGTLYISQLTAEIPLILYIKDKWESMKKCGTYLTKMDNSIITTQSTGVLSQIPNECVDYIFTDPPFGENLNYSELNSIWETMIGIITNTTEEAIINSYQNKGLVEYQRLIEKCFREMYRIIKQGRWITVEFHNSKNSVWNSIQEALSRAGFIIADVRVLDKKKGTTKQLSYMTTAKQDLVISAYKPTEQTKLRIIKQTNAEISAWEFIRSHLEHLPVYIGGKGFGEIIIERTPRVLYDRMVAYHVQNGYSVPISSAEFQVGLAQRFPMRDGMVFLESQVAEYDKKRVLAKEFVQMSLFVSDENSAIEWLRQQLMKKPQTRQDLHPNFMKEIQHISKHEILPELDKLLEQNFLQYEGTGHVPSQIHSYLSTNYKDLRELNKEDTNLQQKAKGRWYVPDPNKQADLEKIREKSLLREFATYIEEVNNTKKKLKQFRLEAIRTGFKKAWAEKDYKTIVDIGTRIPEKVLQEDDKLLMYYDNAQVRLDM